MNSLKDVLEERGETYGTFEGNADITQRMKLIWQGSPGFKRSSYYHREAMDMILHKISRICNGKPDHADSWQDIAGYAQLVVDILNNKCQPGDEIARDKKSYIDSAEQERLQREIGKKTEGLGPNRATRLGGQIDAPADICQGIRSTFDPSYIGKASEDL